MTKMATLPEPIGLVLGQPLKNEEDEKGQIEIEREKNGVKEDVEPVYRTELRAKSGRPRKVWPLANVAALKKQARDARYYQRKKNREKGQVEDYRNELGVVGGRPRKVLPLAHVAAVKRQARNARYYQRKKNGNVSKGKVSEGARQIHKGKVNHQSTSSAKPMTQRVRKIILYREPCSCLVFLDSDP